MDFTEELFHLARVAMEGRPQDVAVLVRKYARRYRSTAPELAERLTALLRDNAPSGSPTRRIEPGSVPVDGDSRLPLIRMVETPTLPGRGRSCAKSLENASSTSG